MSQDHPVPEQTARHEGATTEQPLPAVGEKWCCTTETGTRTVTVTRVWDLDDGYGLAVTFEWRDDTPRTNSSALRLPAFLGTYQPEAAASGAPAGDTLPEWLCSRYRRYAFPFDNRTWEQLPGEDRSYWEHEAAAVRRAVGRGGFKTPAGGEQQPQRDARMTAAAYRAAADIADQLPTPDCAEMNSYDDAWDSGTYAVATELRARADEMEHQ